MSKQIAVIGLGQFSSQVAISLTQKGFEVIGIDEEDEIVAELKDLVSAVVALDATDEKAMRAVNVDNVDMALVAIGTNVQSSLLTVALLQKLGIEEIYVRSINSLQEGILHSMGIEHIVNIEEEMGKQLSSAMSSGRVGRYIQISERHSLTEVNVPKTFVNKSLKELKFRTKYNVNIVGIKRHVPHVDDEGEVRYDVEMMDTPDPNYPLEMTDMLVLLGTDENIHKFVRIGDSDD